MSRPEAPIALEAFPVTSQDQHDVAGCRWRRLVTEDGQFAALSFYHPKCHFSFWAMPADYDREGEQFAAVLRAAERHARQRRHMRNLEGAHDNYGTTPLF